MKIEFTPENKNDRIFLLVCAGISIFAYVGTYLLLPGYLFPFLVNKFCLAIILISLAWQALGSALTLVLPAMKPGWKRIIARIMFILIFVCPNFLLPIIGPFIATCFYIPGEIARIIKSIFSWF